MGLLFVIGALTSVKLVCALAKIKRLPFPKSRSHPAKDIGDVVHSDVWGPAPVAAIEGASYAMTFVDEHSRFGVVTGLRAKSEVFGEYKCHEPWLKVQFGKDIRRLQSDRGGEYMGNEFRLLSQYLQDPGRPHWEQAKRVIRYLKGTRDRELRFGSTGGIEGFSDTNWGNDIDDRHSICGYVFTLNGGAISWSSKKQLVVASPVRKPNTPPKSSNILSSSTATTNPQ